MSHDAEKVRAALTAGVAPPLVHIRELLAERDELARLVANMPRCGTTSPVHGSFCSSGLAGHDGPHRSAGDYTWT
ncbi:MAG: hypothetical protein L0I76_08400 [Pseudonocardia sp.]|nr:hypothetical protein [Pseudonocardia sp.]